MYYPYRQIHPVGAIGEVLISADIDKGADAPIQTASNLLVGVQTVVKKAAQSIKTAEKK